MAASVVNGNSHFLGINHLKTHPKMLMRSDRDDTIYSSHHAEIDALLRAKRKMGAQAFNRKIKKLKLYVCRVTPAGDFTMSKPCQHCQKKIKSLGLLSKNVYYTDYDGKWQRLSDS